jgi:hypothetical protein
MQGLRQQILTATSDKNIAELLNTGKTYEFASDKTKNSWKNAARRKLSTKSNDVVVTAAPQEEEVIDTTPKKKRGNKKKDHTI